MKLMKIMNHLTRIMVATVALSLAQFSAAQNVNEPSPPEGTKTFGDYQVHYTTFNSLFVPADIARVHDLVRADNQSLINISVQKQPGAQQVAAKVTGTAKNLMQQVKNIDFKTIEEPDAIYYIGAVRHTNEEILHLDISVIPEGESNPLDFRLTRKLYTEN